MIYNTSKIVDYVLNRYNIDLSIYEDSYIKKVISSRIKEVNILNSIDYISYLDTHKDEFYNLNYSFLNGYSSFFRDSVTFSVLRESVLPDLINKLKPNEELRIWSVGCSTGQEPYSLAILCEEVKEQFPIDFNYRIFATDINEKALEFAQKGMYSNQDLGKVQLRQLEIFFNKNSKGYTVKNSLKKNISFIRYDIVLNESKYLPESIFGNFDMVFCGNVLIYYNNNVQEDVIEKITGSIKDTGYFVTSSAEKEQLKISSELSLTEYSTSIFKKNRGLKL